MNLRLLIPGVLAYFLLAAGATAQTHPEAEPRWKITKATGINDHGMVTATGTDQQTGASHALLLLLVELVNGQGEVLRAPKVANLTASGALTGSFDAQTHDLHSAVLHPEDDLDCFYVRVKGGARLGTPAKIGVETRGNPDSTYDDAGNELEMSVDGNDLKSKALLLTSDDADNRYPVGNVVSGFLNDQTHRLQLGGKFRINKLQLGAINQEVALDFPVKPVKHLRVRVTILRLPNGVPVISSAQVQEDIKLAQDRFAQAGIVIDPPTIQEADPPRGVVVTVSDPPLEQTTVSVDLSDGVTCNNVNKVGQPIPGDGPELLAIGIALGSDPDAEINVYYVNYLHTYKDQTGINPEKIIVGQSIPRNTAYPKNAKAENSSFISADTRGPFTLAHEMVHLLQPNRLAGEDDANHWPAGDSIKLMRDGGGSHSDVIGGSKRLTPAEIAIIQTSPLVH